MMENPDPDSRPVSTSAISAIRGVKVLLAAHIGQPWGGISALHESLLASTFPRQVELRFVETQDGRGAFSQGGTLAWVNLWNSLRHIVRFGKTFLQFRPQIVHIATAHSVSFLKHSVMVLMARMLGARVVLAPHCSLARFLPEPPSLWRRYVLFVLGRCDGLVALSREWLELQGLVGKLAIRYIPNALDLRDLLGVNRPVAAAAGARVQFLYLGHVGEEKGTYDILAAAKALLERPTPAFSIELVGGVGLRPGDLEETERRIAEAGLEDTIHVRGSVRGAAKLKCFEDADVYLMPSHHEGMPVSIIEAMAAGLPVIGTTVGGIPDLVEDGVTGLLVQPQRPDLLADEMAELIQSRELGMEMGRRGRQAAAENHEIETYAERLLELYALVVK